ncbi:MAG: phosphatase PAP2 family protein [Patescibacteria group bacterium]|jgi:membrane-associated phospholipid phosphatase
MKSISLFSIKAKIEPFYSTVLGLLLIVTTVVLIVLIGNTLDHVGFIVAFDKFIYEQINLGAHPGWLNKLVAPFNFNFIPQLGTLIPNFLYFVFALGFLDILLFNRKDFGYALLAIVFAFLVDYYLFKITNSYVFRDRPFIHLLNTVPDGSKAIWTHWPTYPSGHVRDMALYSIVLSGFGKYLKWPFVIVTLWVGYTRIYLGAHYPTDVLAGLLLGYFIGYGILIIIKSWQKLIRDRKIRRNIKYFGAEDN